MSVSSGVDRTVWPVLERVALETEHVLAYSCSGDSP